jgi:alkylhydroperoxidase family enzyme
MSSVAAGAGTAREARVAPGSPQEIGRLNAVITRALGVAAGTGPPNLFTTLARHRRLFRPWLRFAGRLMPGGTLPRADSELVILRVAANCASEYEWRHHERLGRAAGLTPAKIAAAREGAGSAEVSPRQRLLIRAADELHAERDLSDGLWAELRALLSEPELIELCMLVGHYEMLAMTLNALRVQPDPAPSGPAPRVLGALQRAAERRRGGSR